MKRTDLARYLDLVRRRWQMLVLIVALVVGASLLQSLTSTKQYETSSRVIVVEQNAADVVVSRPSRDLSRALPTERRALESQQLQALVTEQLRRDVDVRFGSQSPDLLIITARDSDPNEAAVAANVYARTFVEFRKNEAIERIEVTRRQLLVESESLQDRIIALEQEVAADTNNRGADVSLENRRLQQDEFLGQIDSLDFLISSETGGLELGEAASVPASPVSPRPVRGAAFAFVLGSILALGVALALEALDDTVRSSRRLAGLTKGAPVLGVIPPYIGAAPTIATLDRPDDPATEAYSNLRTAFLAVLRDQTRPIVQVTSAGANEGKSVVATNLAVTLSQIGLRVALVDADLRNPSLRRFFPQLPETGLAEILEGELPIDTQLSDIGETMVLHALPAGLPDASPAELLSSPTAKQVFGRIAVEHDVTIVDTSSVIGFADANVIAALADFTLMVVRAGDTKSEQVRRAFDALALIDARPLGVVLTDSRDSVAGTETAIAPARRIRRRSGADTPELAPVVVTPEPPEADDGNVRHLSRGTSNRSRRGRANTEATVEDAEIVPLQPADPVPTPVALYDVDAAGSEPAAVDPSATTRLGDAAAIAAVQQTARADDSSPAASTAAAASAPAVVPPAPPPETATPKPAVAAEPAEPAEPVPAKPKPQAKPAQAKPNSPNKPAAKQAAQPRQAKQGTNKASQAQPKKAVDPSTTTPGAVPKSKAPQSKAAQSKTGRSAKGTSKTGPAKADPAKAEPAASGAGQSQVPPPPPRMTGSKAKPADDVNIDLTDSPSDRAKRAAKNAMTAGKAKGGKKAGKGQKPVPTKPPE